MSDPRHLNPTTAETVAIPRIPRHADASDPVYWKLPTPPMDHAPAGQLPTDEQPFWRPVPPVPYASSADEARWIPEPEPEPQPRIVAVGWWARFKRWLLGEEQWKR